MLTRRTYHHCQHQLLWQTVTPANFCALGSQPRPVLRPSQANIWYLNSSRSLHSISLTCFRPTSNLSVRPLINSNPRSRLPSTRRVVSRWLKMSWKAHTNLSRIPWRIRRYWWNSNRTYNRSRMLLWSDRKRHLSYSWLNLASKWLRHKRLLSGW